MITATHTHRQVNGSSDETGRRKALFHLPKHMLDQCFTQRDRARLEKHFDCIYPTDSSEETLRDTWDHHASTIHAVITGWDSPTITESMLAIAPHLEVIIHSAGSIRPFIPDSVWDSGIRIATANDALGKGVAETTLGLIIAGLKGFSPCGELTRAGQWQKAIPQSGYGRVRELYEVTIGLIGASRTGRHVLRLLSAFDAKVIIHDPTLSKNEVDELGVPSVSLDELMATSDVVSLHAPALPQLRHMLSSKHFRQMKQDAIFINTARGMLVDEQALTEELLTGRISAILDVTFPEPPDENHAFRHLPNVLLLPHISGALTTGCLRQGESTVDQLLEFTAGETMSGEINRERFAVMA